MTAVTERHVVGPVFHQQIRLGGRVRLVTGQAVDLAAYLGGILGVHLVRHRMAFSGMTQAVLDGKVHGDRRVLLGHRHLAVEDGYEIV